MKILIVQDTDWIKRYPIQHMLLAEKLVLKGHEIRVIDYEILWRTEKKKELLSKRQVFNVSRVFANANVMVIRPRILKIPLLDYVSMLFTYKKEIDRQILEFNPAVIIGHDVITAFLAAKACYKNKIPFIYYFLELSYLLIPFKPLQPLGKLFEIHALKYASKILSTTDKLRESIAQLGTPMDRIQVLKIGVDLESFNPANIGKEIRAQYGYTNDDIVMLFVGSLYEFSGLKEICIKLADNKINRVKLLIVGDGASYIELQSIRDKYNLGDRLILTGRKPFEEIPAIISASDVCILPFKNVRLVRDVAPQKIYEYLASGKPVISTQLPGMVSEFGEGNGIVYVNYPEDIPAKAIEIIDNNHYKELCLQARNYVKDHSWDKITDQYEAIIQEVVRIAKTHPK